MRTTQLSRDDLADLRNALAVASTRERIDAAAPQSGPGRYSVADCFAAARRYDDLARRIGNGQAGVLTTCNGDQVADMAHDLAPFGDLRQAITDALGGQVPDTVREAIDRAAYAFVLTPALYFWTGRLVDASRALLGEYGCDTPDWLRPAAEALVDAADQAEKAIGDVQADAMHVDRILVDIIALAPADEPRPHQEGEPWDEEIAFDAGAARAGWEAAELARSIRFTDAKVRSQVRRIADDVVAMSLDPSTFPGTYDPAAIDVGNHVDTSIDEARRRMDRDGQVQDVPAGADDFTRWNIYRHENGRRSERLTVVDAATERRALRMARSQLGRVGGRNLVAIRADLDGKAGQ